jgi:WD40 repeat protein
MPRHPVVSAAEKRVSLLAAVLFIAGISWPTIMSLAPQPRWEPEPTASAPPAWEPPSSVSAGSVGGDFQADERSPRSATAASATAAAVPLGPKGEPLPAGALACLGGPRLQHVDATGLALAPDGKWLVSWSSKQVSLWDARTGEALRHWIAGYESRCLGCAVVDGGRAVRIAEVGAPEGRWDAWVRDCDVVTGAEQRRLWLRRQSGKPLHVVLSADGNWAGCWEKGSSTWSLCDLSADREPVTLTGPPTDAHGLVFAAGGKCLAVADPDGNGVRQRTIRFFEIPTGRLLGQYQDVMPPLAALAFAPDGKALAVSGERAIVLVEVPSGKVLHRFESDALVRPALAFHVDGSRLVVGGNAPVLRTWDIASGAELPPYRFHGAPADESRARTAYVLRPTQAVRFAANGKTLAALDAGGRIRLWEPATEDELAPLHGHGGPVAAVALSADEHLLATAVRDTIYVWDIDSGRELCQLVAREESGPLSFSGDGRTVWYGTQDGGFRRWDLPPLDRPVQQVASRKDAPTRFLTFTAGGLQLRHTAAGPKAADVLSVGPLADLDSGLRFVLFPEDEPKGTLVTLTPDGRTAASNSATLGRSDLRIWDPARRMGVRQHTVASKVTTIALSPDGRTLATYTPRAGGVIELWETTTWQRRAVLLRPQRRGDGTWMLPSALTFSRDGSLLVSGDGDGGVRVWDLASGQQVHEFLGHRRMVAVVAFTRDDRRLISAGEDGLVFVWDLAPVYDRPDFKQPGLTAAPLEHCWAALASSDHSFKGIWAMASSPVEAVAFLERKLQPVPRKDPERVARLIADLDSDKFLVRQKATEELERLDELAEPELRAAQAANRSLETTRRLEALLQRIDKNRQPQEGERLQQLHALEVLELAGTPEACLLLQNLSKGAPGSSITREAQAALRRLDSRRSSSPRP